MQYEAVVSKVIGINNIQFCVRKESYTIPHVVKSHEPPDSCKVQIDNMFSLNLTDQLVIRKGDDNNLGQGVFFVS